MGDQLVKDAAVALQRLLTSPDFAELDRVHSISGDLKNIALSFRVKDFIEDRIRMNRLNGAWFLEENATATPDKDAIWCNGNTWSWLEVSNIVDRFAQWFLSQGVRPRDQVAMMMVNTEEFIFTLLALTKLGAIVCTIDFNLRDKALKHVLSLHKLSAIVTNSHLAAHVKPVYDQLEKKPLILAAWNAESVSLPTGTISLTVPGIMAHARGSHKRLEPYPLKMEDLGYVLYTSGTTGMPKGVPFPVSKLIVVSAAWISWDIKRDDRIGIYTPMYHGAAMSAGVLTALSRGATWVIFKEFSASRFWQRAIDSGMTRAVYVGEILRYLMNQPPSPLEKQHKIRTWNGVGLRPEMWVEFKQRFGATDIVEWWGQTESPQSLINHQQTRLDGAEFDTGIVGRVGTIAKLTSGIKWFRHDAVTGKPYKTPEGYLEEVPPGVVGEMDSESMVYHQCGTNEEASNSKIVIDPLGPGTGHWYLTGDVLLRDAEGRVSFKDRTGDTYRWKGENVATTQVELAVLSVPGVLQANCYGVPVPFHDGKAGMVALVLDDKFNMDNFAKIIVDQLPPYAWPLFLRVTPAENIQVSAIFKLLKVALSAAAMDPAKVNGDKLYMFDQKTKAYLPFGPAEYAKLVAARSKL